MYKVEIILEKKEENGQTSYKIKWQGWSMGHCTWEPTENLQNPVVLQMISEFNKNQADGVVDSIVMPKKSRGRPKGSFKNPERKMEKTHLSEVGVLSDYSEMSEANYAMTEQTVAKPKKMKTYKAIKTGKPIKPSQEPKSDNSTDDRDPKEYTKSRKINSLNSPISVSSPYSDPVDLIEQTESYEDEEYEEVVTKSQMKKSSGQLVSYEAPKRIISAKKTKDEIIFNCEWKERKDGTRLENCYVTNDALITYFPSLLINFYQNKLFSNSNAK